MSFNKGDYERCKKKMQYCSDQWIAGFGKTGNANGRRTRKWMRQHLRWHWRATQMWYSNGI